MAFSKQSTPGNTARRSGFGVGVGERGKNTGTPCYQIRGSTPWRALLWQRVSAADPARPATNVVSRSLLPASTLSHNAALLAGCQDATARIANVFAAADGRHRQDRICRARTLRPDPCVGGATIRGLYASISLLRFALDCPDAVAAQCPPSYYGSLCTPRTPLSAPFDGKADSDRSTESEPGSASSTSTRTSSDFAGVSCWAIRTPRS